MSPLNKFREALAFTLPHEGNTTTDTGGLTKWGISQAEYPEEDIKNLTPERALFLYNRDYWIPIGGPLFDFPYCVAAFDTAVNCGVPRTLGWIRRSESASWESLLAYRVQYYATLSKYIRYSKYYKGWINRVNDLRKYCEINDKDTNYGV